MEAEADGVQGQWLHSQLTQFQKVPGICPWQQMKFSSSHQWGCCFSGM